MLSEQSAPVVRATLPAVGAAIGDITELFYRKLFDAHPELLRDLFNRGNQAIGEQQKALAGSIAAFAGMLLERPDARSSVPTSGSDSRRTAGRTDARRHRVPATDSAADTRILRDGVRPLR